MLPQSYHLLRNLDSNCGDWSTNQCN
uniref:Uncharacterized protein n=1 Tax=Rhizophora mucronata TaxID=61149 RepID=A0A2P2N8L7_RHIMU